MAERSKGETTCARDPFARGEYRRRTYVHGECEWCGQKRERLYSYSWEEDGWGMTRSRRWEDEHMFCNLECRKAYYGG